VNTAYVAQDVETRVDNRVEIERQSDVVHTEMGWEFVQMCRECVVKTLLIMGSQGFGPTGSLNPLC
jgi:hypothetical protein